MPPARAWTGDAWEHDPLVIDDQALVVHVRDLGLVLTGCGHAGAVNIVRHAQRLTGVDRLHALLGGLHLGGRVRAGHRADRRGPHRALPGRWSCPGTAPAGAPSTPSPRPAEAWVQGAAARRSDWQVDDGDSVRVPRIWPCTWSRSR